MQSKKIKVRLIEKEDKDDIFTIQSKLFILSIFFIIIIDIYTTFNYNHQIHYDL